MSFPLSHHTPRHNNRHRDKRPHQVIGSAPDQQYPISKASINMINIEKTIIITNTNLHGDHSIVHCHFFCTKISTNCGFVLIRESFVHILIHQGGLTHTTVAQDNHLQQGLFTCGHFVEGKL